MVYAAAPVATDGPDENTPAFDINNSETWPLHWPVDGGIPYCELVYEPAGPEFTFKNDGTTATRTIIVPWADIKNMWQFLGKAFVVTGEGGSQYLSRWNPWFVAGFVDSESKNYLYATQITRCSPWGVPPRDANGWSNMKDEFGVAAYKFAKMAVHFETLPWDVCEDSELPKDDHDNPDESSLQRYVVKIVKPSGQYLTLPSGSFKASIPGSYANGDHQTAVVPGTPGRIVAKFDLALTWCLVPEACVGTRLINPLRQPIIEQQMGLVNKSTFAGCPPGTLLLTAATIKPIRSPNGDRIYDIEYRFSFFLPITGGQQHGDPPTTLDAIAGAGHQFLYLPQFSLATVPGSPPASYFECSVDGQSNISITAGINELGLPGRNIFDWAEFADLFRVPPLLTP